MLIEFYGEECPHCIKLKPLIERLEKEEGAKVERRETWHDQENEKLRQEHDKGLCGGVPFLINTVSGKFVCGEVPYEELKNII